MLSNIKGAPIERGELEVIAKHYLAIIQDKPIRDVQMSDEGIYNFNIEMGISGKEKYCFFPMKATKDVLILVIYNLL